MSDTFAITFKYMVPNPALCEEAKKIIIIKTNADSKTIFILQVVDEMTVAYDLKEGNAKEREVPTSSFFTVEINRFYIREIHEFWMEVRVNGASLLQRKVTSEAVGDILVEGRSCDAKFKNFFVKLLH